MKTLCEYLHRTESAAHILFRGLAGYRAILTGAEVQTLIVAYRDDADLERQTTEWLSSNERAIVRQKEAFASFAAETFFQATLAGAILQLASAAIEQFGVPRALSSDALQVVPPSKSQFWAGRIVRGLPLGAVLLAGRNQHMHSSDKDFNRFTTAAFARMATAHGFPGYENVSDPGLSLASRDRDNPLLRSLAHNILFVTGWKSPSDMREDLTDIIGTGGPVSFPP